MSAALQLAAVWGAGSAQLGWPANADAWEQPRNEVEQEQRAAADDRTDESADRPEVQLAFLRRHTESLLRRYLYASIQIGRSPSLLGDPVGRGWASSRPVRTFEDAVIFVLDVERCLAHLNALDRAMLSRMVLQEYTYAEASALLGMSVRTISHKFPIALDRLTERLLESGLLVVPG
jgi:hypothetical protein